MTTNTQKLWTIWECSQTTGTEWIVSTGSDEAEMRRALEQYHGYGRDVWLRAPDGTKHLPGVALAPAQPVAMTDEQWIDLAQRHANADWNSDQPDGYLDAIKAVARDFAALTASEGAEPVAVATLKVRREFHEYQNSAKEDHEGYLVHDVLVTAAGRQLPIGEYALTLSAQQAAPQLTEEDDEPVPTRGTDAIVRAWNDLPDRLRLAPELIKLFEAVKTCRDVDGYDAAQAAPKVPEIGLAAMRDFLTGVSVSVDVSTGDDDAGRRLMGTVTEVMDTPGDFHGVTLLVEDAEPNWEPEAMLAAASAPSVDAKAQAVPANGFKYFFISREPGKAPRIGFPVGDMRTSVLDWLKHSSAGLDVVTWWADGGPSPGTATVETAADWLYADDPESIPLVAAAPQPPAPSEQQIPLQSMIYSWLMHHGKPKTVAEFERAANDVAEALSRGWHLAPSEQRKPLTEGFTADVECITDESGTEYSVAVRGPGIRNPLYSDVWLKKKPATLLAKWLNGEVFPAIGIRSTGGEHE